MKPHGQPLSGPPLLMVHASVKWFQVPEMKWSVHFQANRGPARQSLGDLVLGHPAWQVPGGSSFFFGFEHKILLFALSTKFLLFLLYKRRTLLWLWGLSKWLSAKESACNAGDTGNAVSIPELGRSPGGGHGNPL